MEAPFGVGERVDPEQFGTWEFVGLSGRPGLDKHSVRRYKNVDWTLEVRAHQDPRSSTRVVSIRTLAEDAHHWSETRARLMRHKTRQR